YEHYMSHVGLIQAGFFYKQLSDTLVTTSYKATNDSYNNPGNLYTNDLVAEWLNVGNAHIYGIELSYQQRLSMLPGALGGFGMFANYSWTSSQVDYLPGRTDSPALQRQSPNTWNISPTYDRGPFSVRVGLSYNGPNIYQYQYQTASDV